MEKQAFEQNEKLKESILHAATFWKTDDKWSNHLAVINQICEDNNRLKSKIDEINFLNFTLSENNGLLNRTVDRLYVEINELKKK